MEVGARAAFWDFNKPLLDRLAMDNIPKIIIPGGSSLFSTLFKIIKQVLKLQDEDVVQIHGTRLDLKSGAGSNLEEFLQLDEACQALDEWEKKALTSEQKVLSAEVAQVREFKQHWKERKAKLPSEIAKAKARAAAAKPAAAPKAKGKTKAKAAVAPPPPVPPTLQEDIDEQADMRQFVPPGGHLWRANTGHAWCGHSPPYARVNKAWHMYGGHRQSLKLVLQHLWRQCCEYNLLSCPQDVPVRGVFP